MGLVTAIAVVTGTMIGSGIFLLPSALASFGGISIVGWLFTSAGALLIALSLSRLSRMIPKAGGPYAYTQAAFGDFPGFLMGWGYYIALLTAGAAIAVAFVGYLGVFIPGLTDKPAASAICALIVIWAVTAVNVYGVRQAGALQLWTTVLKILPLLVMILAGALYFNADHFTPFNASGDSSFSAITATATLTLWAYVGLESAAVLAESVRDPERNVPRATMIGTLITAAIYILGTAAVMGIMHPDALAISTAPFADAAEKIWGEWAGYMIATGAVISCLGALNGLIFVQGQMPFAMARDKLFPAGLARISKRGTPIRSLVLSGAVVTIFMAFNYTRGLVELFKFLILLATLSALLPYAFCTMAEIALVGRKRWTMSSRKIRTVVITATLAFVYSMWTVVGAGERTVAWGFMALLAGIPVFVWYRWKHDQNQRDEEPTDRHTGHSP